jgi:hypothetical protein
MAYLVSDVTAQVRDHMSDFPPDSDALALTLVNLVQTDIVRRVRIYPLQTFTINLVANQQEYDLDPTVWRIWSCLFNQDPNTNPRIWETSIDELDAEMPNWRMATPSFTPYKYYEQGRKIGFWPTPNTSGSSPSTYPFITMYCLTTEPLASTASSFPSFLPTVDPWVWGVCARWAAMQRRDDVTYFTTLAEGSLNDLISFVNGVLVRQKPSVRANYRRPRNR